MDFRAEELVESVLIDTLAYYGTTKTPQTAAGKWEFPQVHYTALKGQCSSEVGNHILEVFILGGKVGDDNNILLLCLLDRGQRWLIYRFFPCRYFGRRSRKQPLFTGKDQLVKEVPGLPLSLLRQKIVHVSGQTTHDPHSQVKAVFLNIAVRRHIIEMLGRGDLAGKLAGEVHAVRLDELKQPVELIRGDESVDRIRKQDQLCLFQLLPQRRKVLFIAFDPLAHRENGEFMFRVQRLQIEGRVDCGGIFPLGAGVQNKNFHDSSSNS